MLDSTFGGDVESSVIFSMGTALSRAKDHDLPVAVLVGNDWLRGRILAMDGHGLLLETDQLEHCVVRLEAVSAVRVDAMVHESAGLATPLRAAP
jgi:hypothetical protein